MKLIGWDTSSKSGALVALEWDAEICLRAQGWKSVRLVSEFTLNVDLTHSERLLWGVHQILESARWKLEDEDVIAVGVGPGSFTGLRIGITTARTLAHTLKKPLIGVSSLAALARPLALNFAQESLTSIKTLVIAATDACKGELFALWGTPQAVAACVVRADDESGCPGLWGPGAREEVIEPQLLVEMIQKEILKDPENTRWIVVGEGRNRYSEIWAQLPRELVGGVPYPYSDQVQGRYLGLLAWEGVQAGLAREGLLVHPQYLRASDAELKLKARQLGIK